MTKKTLFFGHETYFWCKVILGLVLLLGIVLLFFAGFTTQITQQEQLEAEQRLQEATQLSTFVVRAHVEASKDFIQGAARSVAGMTELTSPETLALLQNVASDGPFQWILLVDRNGMAHLSDQEPFDVGERAFFQQALQGETSLSEVYRSHLDLNPIISVATPVIGADGTVIAVLYGACEIDQMLMLSDVPLFDGVGATYLYQRRGDLIQRTPGNTPPLLDDSGLFESLALVEWDAGFTIEQLRNDLRHEQSRLLRYRYLEQDYWMHYMPVGVNDWYLFSTVPAWVVDQTSRPPILMAFRLTGSLFLVFALLLGSGSIYANRSHKRLARANEELAISVERYRIATEHNSDLVFDYDLETHTVYHRDQNRLLYGLDEVIENVPDSLIANGTIQPDSADAFHGMYQRLFDGAAIVSSTVRTLQKNGTIAWNKITLSRVYDQQRRTVRVIGTVRDITALKEIEQRSLQGDRMREAMLSEAVVSFEANLTANQLRHGFQDWATRFELFPCEQYDQMMRQICSHVIHPEDRANFLSTFLRRNLLSIFANGVSETRLEFRYREREGVYLWGLGVTHLLSDPLTGDVLAFSYVRNIDSQKQEVLSLQYLAERDSLTGLLNKRATEGNIRAFLQSTEARQASHALMVLDLDNFKGLNDTKGHQYGDLVLTRIAQSLQSTFRESDIVGRIGGDEFMILLKNIGSKEVAYRKADAACRLFQQTNADLSQGGISGSVGLTVVQGKIPFEQLFRQADLALYRAKRDGKARFALYEPSMQLCVDAP